MFDGLTKGNKNARFYRFCSYGKEMSQFNENDWDITENVI